MRRTVKEDRTPNLESRIGFPLVLAFCLLCSLFWVSPVHSDESGDIHFIRNMYQSVLSREPRTAEYDRWLKFLAAGGEKSRMLQMLKDSNEFFRRFTPAGRVVRLNLTVYVQPEARALRAGNLMPGDRFRVVGRVRDWYKIETPALAGWVERDGVEIVYEMQKIGRVAEGGTADAGEAVQNSLARLALARRELLDLLLRDGKSFLFQFRPGEAVAGEQALQRYRDVLREFLVLRKVRDAEGSLRFRAVELSLSDRDLTDYEILRRLDEWAGRGADRVLVRSFRAGVSAFPGFGEGNFTRLPFSQVYDRWRDEAARRDLSLGVSLTLGDFGPNLARERGEWLARNGAGFSSGRYQPGLEFVDPLLPDVRREGLKLLRQSLELPDTDLVMLDGVYPPAGAATGRDIRAHFVFNPQAVLAFEKEAGFPVAEMDLLREKVFIGWRRSLHREYYTELHQAIVAAGKTLALVLPDHDGGEVYPWAPWRELPADWLLVDRPGLEKMPREGAQRLVLLIRCQASGPSTDPDRDVRELQKQHPRLVGWLCREEGNTE